MDFLDPKKKRAHRIRLYIGYGLVAVALAFATLIIVFAAYGYDIDRETGGIIQNGLVVVDAHPEPATVHVNGEAKGTTDTRLVLPADTYTFELTRDGYAPWKRVINLEGSSIEQLVYPFLYPEKLVTKTLQTYSSTPSMASESPDRRWLVVALPETPGSFHLVDLSTDTHPATTIKLPTDTITSVPGTQSFQAVEWSTDNTHLLIKHTFATGVEFIMLNRERPENSINLNKVFADQPFTTISLRDKKPGQFYMFNAPTGSLYTGDTQTRAATLLLPRILAYKAYENNTVLYVTNPKNKPDAEVRILEKGQDYLVRTVPKAGTYMLDMAKFNGQFYLVAGSPADERTYVYKDPFNDLRKKPSQAPQPFRVLITAKAEFVSFSANARFIAVQGGSNFAVYDAETGRQFRYDTKLSIATKQKATWMDGHRLVLNSQDKVNVFDFDGINKRQLTSSLPSFVPFFDRDYNALFTIAPASTSEPGKAILTRTELKVLPSN